MFYLINKPIGYTSFDLIRCIRKITGIKKIGHTGTLDPLAHGCMVIVTDNSTKLISRLENQTKRYRFTVDISIFTPSFDLDGKSDPISCDITNIIPHSDEELKKFIESQKSQIPPKYSAIHIDGKRAYDLARKWKDFEMMERPIEVFDVVIIEQKMPYITIELSISSGWYIRSFAPLIGTYFGSTGWCITDLHRTQIWNLKIEDCQSLDTFDITNPIPYKQLFGHIEEYHLAQEYKKPLIDGLIVNDGSNMEWKIWQEVLIYCDDICSLGKWTNDGIEVIRNYV